MRIIKVAHEDGNRSIENESSVTILQNYDAKRFVSKYGSDIIRRGQDVQQITLSSIPDYDLTNDNHLHEIIIKQTISTLITDILGQIESVEVVSIKSAQEMFPRTQNTITTGMYTLHPCDEKSLTRLEHFHKNLAMEKDDELIKILGMMGAKTVKIIESDSLKTTTSGEIAVKTIVVNVEAGEKSSKNIEGSREMVATFEGNLVDISPDLLKDSLWYAHDAKFNNILECRMFKQNRIRTYGLRNTYTETFDFNFRLAAKYIFATEVDLKAEYESISKIERLFFVEFGK